MNRSLLLAAACIFFHASVRAQDFNIDVGTINAIPSPLHGGAAAQPGTWNQWNPSAGPLTLVDLAGAGTGVTITRTSGLGYDYHWDNVATFGDFEALLDDGEDPSNAGVYSMTGLQAGTYSVTTYAWAPDNDSYAGGVIVNGGPVTSVGGTFNGYQLGVTHAVDTVTIPAGGTIDVTVYTLVSYSTFNGLQIRRVGTAITSFCSGDGSATACPCGNAGTAGNGCASSSSAVGAHLGGSGNASIANDTLVLQGSLMPNSSALYFQGSAQVNGGGGAVFGDGLRCVVGSIIRLGLKINSAGSSSYPSAGDPSISVKGASGAGALRYYQVWYRNAAPFCTPATFNLSNGVEITWAP